jgi:choline dehydrogenase-like flavoprotein
VRVITGAQAQRILLSTANTDTDTVKATGVEALVDGKVETFNAGREVILAAGVFNTPKLLEISGIGDKHLLDIHGIQTRVHLPGVGENLQVCNFDVFVYRSISWGSGRKGPVPSFQNPPPLRLDDVVIAHKSILDRIT